MAIFRATVNLYLEVEDNAQACDAVNEILREHLRKFAPESCLVDWSYPGSAGVYDTPVELTEEEIEEAKAESPDWDSGSA